MLGSLGDLLSRIMAGTGPGQISSDGHQVLIDFSSTGLDAIRHGGLQNKERLPESNLQAALELLRWLEASEW